MNIYFIVNEHAGNGRGKKIWQTLKSRLDFSFTEYKTEYPRHAIDIVNQISKKREVTSLVIAIGGDGTFNEVITGAIGQNHIIISAVKAGSGNDFARGYTVFSKASELNAYVKEKLLLSQDMDIGNVRTSQKEGPFVNNIGFGFDALVATTVNQSRIKAALNKVGLGRLAYVLLTIKLLFSFKTFNVKALIDDKHYSFNQVWFIAVCNQPYFGGGMKISPRSKMNDDKLEAVIVQHLSPIKLLFLFASVFTGQHERLKHITFISAKSIELKFEEAVVSHVDGDLLAHIQPKSAVKVEVHPLKWRLAK